MNSLLLLALFSAVVTKVAGVPIAGEQIVILCPDKEQWYDCGPCEGTCSNLHPACPMMSMCRPSARSGCGCIEGHVRDDKQRCIPKELCQTVEPAEVLPPVVPAEELHPPVVPAAEVLPPVVPAEEVHPPVPMKPVQQIVILCPAKEQWYDCGPCEGTCSNLHPACPIMPMCQRSERSGCGCIEGHVRDDKQRCIPKELCQTVEPAEVLPPVVPAEELHPPVVPAAEVLPPVVPAEELHPPVVPAAEVHPPMVPVQQMCPEKEMWFPCGACDGTCSGMQPICTKMCRPQGSCGCIADHVREPKGHNCIHESDACAVTNSLASIVYRRRVHEPGSSADAVYRRSSESRNILGLYYSGD
uniref:TIL domain-containing protein n=1 Tax=Plectus sambesii TaxID=2011161 RepID=A0A914XKF5_9BILA